MNISQKWLEDSNGDERSVASQTRSKKQKRGEDKLAQLNVLTYHPPESKLKGIDEENKNDKESSSLSDSSDSDSDKDDDQDESEEETLVIKPLGAKSKKSTQLEPSGLWGVAKVLNSMKAPAAQHAIAKIASGHSNLEFLNLVVTAEDLLAFGVMFTGPYVTVLHSCGMFNNVLDPTSTEAGIRGFLGAGNEISAPPPCSIPKSWLTTKSNKLGLKDDTKIVEQMAANPTQLWNGYEGTDQSDKEQKDAPPMVLLFPDLAAHLL